MRYEVGVDVDAPVEVAWTVLADPAEWPLLTDSFIKVRPKDGSGLVVGQRYVVRQPSMRALTWLVTDVEPGAGFTWRSSVLGVRTEASHRFVPRGSGSRLELRLVQSGPLARITGAIGGTHYRALVDREAATFAGAAEHRAR
ncbi:SRPBCC family protein [Mumia qirimensis]|uniref:SRPBCC family protein n=1 Tax=Mumia qirimensis TaxID=3234852 RepID=UPI00351D688C